MNALQKQEFPVTLFNGFGIDIIFELVLNFKSFIL